MKGIIIEILKSIKWGTLNRYKRKWLHKSERAYREALVKWYHKRTGEELNLEYPQTFNEKIQWLKLYDSSQHKADLADKYKVRKWIADQIGEEYLIPLVAVWDSVEAINFETLPTQCVLKTNHGSSTNIIIKDKSKLNVTEAKLKLKRWLNTNYALKMGFELHYGLIAPKIICEKYMGDNLLDYKLFCFNGVPEFCWVDADRYTGHKRNLYSLEWQELPFTINNYPRYDISRPVNLDKMIELAKVLAEGFSFARVDFYEIDDRLYFGEMTFTSGSGTEAFTPKEYDLFYGNKIILPQKNNIPCKSMKEIWDNGK